MSKYNYNDLIEQIKKIGIKPSDTVIIHSSMKSIGDVEGGADTVIDAFKDYLAEDGKIVKSASKFRALEVVDAKREKPEHPLVEDTLESLNATRVPLLGNIAAGQPLYAAVEDSRSYSMPNDFFSIKSEMFLLQVKGHSMEKVGILDGDVVLVKSQPTANNGQIIVAQIDGNEVTLKRFYNCGSYIKLKPENDDYDDIIVTPDQGFRILGIATGLMRNHIM